jgi:putative addiction module component (TIGR02574 family)
MAEDLSELLKKAMEARAALAGQLLDSLDQTVDTSAEAEWEKELERRVAQLRSGSVQTIPWSEVRRLLSNKLAH